jgi:hypothetical protein
LRKIVLSVLSALVWERVGRGMESVGGGRQNRLFVVILGNFGAHAMICLVVRSIFFMRGVALFQFSRFGLGTDELERN